MPFQKNGDVLYLMDQILFDDRLKELNLVENLTIQLRQYCYCYQERVCQVVHPRDKCYRPQKFRRSKFWADQLNLVWTFRAKIYCLKNGRFRYKKKHIFRFFESVNVTTCFLMVLHNIFRCICKAHIVRSMAVCILLLRAFKGK